VLFALAPAALAALTLIQQIDSTVPVERGQRLEVDLFAGDVDVKTWSKNAVRVVADPDGRGRVEIERSATSLSVRTTGRRGPPLSTDIELTVPAGLVGLATGHRVWERRDGDTVTSRWESSYPVNNYALSIAVGPYVPVEESYAGVDGTLPPRPIVFWSLPEDADKARVLWHQAPRMLAVLGKRFGEYPFLADKFAVAQSPHLGMEHQTLVAYGARFRDNPYNFDWLLVHETAHEWWGNAITVRDWADFWIHEGFAVYSEAVLVNDTLGVDKYLAYMRHVRGFVRNRLPIVRGRGR